MSIHSTDVKWMICQQISHDLNVVPTRSILLMPTVIMFQRISVIFRPFLTKPLTKYRAHIRCITDQIQSEGQFQTMPKLEKYSKFKSKSQTSVSVNYTLCFNQQKWLSVNRESYDSRIQISGHSTMSQTTSSLSKSRSSKCHRDTRVKNHGLQLLLLFPVRRSQCIRSSQATWKQRVHKFFG